MTPKKERESYSKLQNWTSLDVCLWILFFINTIWLSNDFLISLNRDQGKEFSRVLDWLEIQALAGSLLQMPRTQVWGMKNKWNFSRNHIPVFSIRGMKRKKKKEQNGNLSFIWNLGRNLIFFFFFSTKELSEDTIFSNAGASRSSEPCWLLVVPRILPDLSCLVLI